ncbi:DMT family transporter [Saccharibacillus kuerlensis]|uniref:EamA family transporter n=1 Tax=Saccharibacillus kuerlensis TaxID=459527 RepID=A0ABQ2L5V6_9BACL|nr:DMT family transporter [Saccharibacillus kuerlensis]GGO04649.1 EamA family transporter [Saccharibacillus kuerlensis]
MNLLKFMPLIVLTTFLMGSSFAIGKMGLAHASPLMLAGLRFATAGLIMAVIVGLLKRPHPRTLENWMKMLLIGALQTAGVMGCIFISLRTITASESSILTFTNPLLVVVLGTLFAGMRYKWYQWLGVLLGLIGVGITLGTQLQWEAGLLFGLASAFFWATATLLVKKWGGGMDTWVLSAYQMLSGGIILLIGSLLLEQPFFRWNGESVTILLWLSLMSSIVQFAGWYYVLQKSDPGKTSAFLFLAPFFGVLSGWLLLGEPLYPSLIAGGLCILVGIYLVNSEFRNKIKTNSVRNSV